MEFEGDVIESSNGKFKVRINESYIVTCTLGGKIRKFSVRIILGDRVRVEVSEYDTTQGRIVYRMK